MKGHPQKVVLIEPRAGFDAYQFIRIPLIGLLYVATLLRRAGHDVIVLSEAEGPVFHPKAGKLAPELLSADVVGISIMTATANRGYEISAAIKRANPRARIVLGGPHCSLLPNEAAEHADVVVRGEGENIISNIVDPDFTERIVDGGLVADLDMLPFPDYDLQRGLAKSLKFATVSASRGCPFDCDFCCVTRIYGRKVRCRSVESVVDEIELRYKQGYRKLFFGDDNFGARKEWAKELLSETLRRRIQVSWVAQVRADVADDPDLLNLIKASHCSELFIGFEAVTQAALDKYNKSLKVEEVVESVNRLNKHKIDVVGMFVIGSDSDNKDTIKQTLKFCDTMRLRYAQFSILAPFPGTRVAEQLHAEDRIFDRNFSHYDGAHVVFHPKHFSPASLQRDVLRLWRDFYSWAKGFKSIAARHFLNKWEKANRRYLSQLKSYTASLAKDGRYSADSTIAE